MFVGASATGFYGDRDNEVLDERSDPGTGFLAEVCQAWEGAAEPVRQHRIRVVHLRLGIVLAAQGGALAKMLPAFRLGLGGRLGSGRQYWSWITLEDLLGVVEWVLQDDQVSGAVNTVAPEATTNADFTAALARAAPTTGLLAGARVRCARRVWRNGPGSLACQRAGAPGETARRKLCVPAAEAGSGPVPLVGFFPL